MTTLDRSKPHWSAFLWHDGKSIYIQLPESTHIERFPMTEIGLRKALKIVEPCRILQPASSAFTEPQRAFARDLIRRNLR
jgi:hypothetical protein